MFYSDGKEVVKFAKKQTQEFLPQRRKDCEEAEYKLGSLGFLCALSVFAVRMLINGKVCEEAEYKSGFFVFLCALCVFAVRMLWFKKHIQQQEN